MTLWRPSRRAFVQAAAAGAALLNTRPARAAPKLRFLMNWFAEAEHGGYFQAQATGLYDAAGLDLPFYETAIAPQDVPKMLAFSRHAGVIKGHPRYRDVVA